MLIHIRLPVLNTSSPNDESVDAFFTRHFGPDFARTFGSALVHGIYATDSRVLSVRSAFSMMCELEERGKGSAVRGAWATERVATGIVRKWRLTSWASVYSRSRTGCRH